MDYEVPIVASDVDGIPDLVQHEQTGLLVKPNDAEALAQALLRLYRDAPLRRRLAQQAKAGLAHYTPEAMAERYLALYSQLVAR